MSDNQQATRPIDSSAVNNRIFNIRNAPRPNLNPNPQFLPNQVPQILQGMGSLPQYSMMDPQMAGQPNIQQINFMFQNSSPPLQFQGNPPVGMNNLNQTKIPVNGNSQMQLPQNIDPLANSSQVFSMPQTLLPNNYPLLSTVGLNGLNNIIQNNQGMNEKISLENMAQLPMLLQHLNAGAEYQTSKSDYEVAIKYYEKILSLDNENGPAYTALWHCYLIMDDLTKAFNNYQKALYCLNDIKDTQLWYGIALLYEKFEAFEHAIPAYLSVLKISSSIIQKSEVYYRMGIILFKTCYFDKSIFYLREALKDPSIVPNSKKIDIHSKIGLCYQEKKDFANATKSFEEALTYDKSCVKTYQHIAWCNFLAKKFPECESIINIAISLNQNDSDSFYIKSRMLCEKGLFSEAIDTINMAIQKNQRKAKYWCTLGIYQARLKDFKQAFNAFICCNNIDLKIPESWFDLGILYEICKQKDEAIFVLEKSLLYTTDFESSKLRIAKLKNSVEESEEMLLKCILFPEFRVGDNPKPQAKFLNNGKLKYVIDNEMAFTGGSANHNLLDINNASNNVNNNFCDQSLNTNENQNNKDKKKDSQILPVLNLNTIPLVKEEQKDELKENVKQDNIIKEECPKEEPQEIKEQPINVNEPLKETVKEEVNKEPNLHQNNIAPVVPNQIPEIPLPHQIVKEENENKVEEKKEANEIRQAHHTISPSAPQPPVIPPQFNMNFQQFDPKPFMMQPFGYYPNPVQDMNSYNNIRFAQAGFPQNLQNPQNFPISQANSQFNKLLNPYYFNFIPQNQGNSQFMQFPEFQSQARYMLPQQMMFQFMSNDPKGNMNIPKQNLQHLDQRPQYPNPPSSPKPEAKKEESNSKMNTPIKPKAIRPNVTPQNSNQSKSGNKGKISDLLNVAEKMGEKQNQEKSTIVTINIPKEIKNDAKDSDKKMNEPKKLEEHAFKSTKRKNENNDPVDPDLVPSCPKIQKIE